jgi:3-oxoacid CoA-transferase subunit B
MDLVSGAKRVIVTMEHSTREGAPRLLKRCTLPLTGLGVVNTIITDLAYITVTPSGLRVDELMPGVLPADVLAATEAELRFHPALAGAVE